VTAIIAARNGIRVFNPGPIFSIPGFGIGGFLIPGSRRDYGIPAVWYQKPLLLSIYMGLYGICKNFRFLPRDDSAERGNAIVSRPSVRL